VPEGNVQTTSITNIAGPILLYAYVLLYACYCMQFYYCTTMSAYHCTYARYGIYFCCCTHSCSHIVIFMLRRVSTEYITVRILLNSNRSINVGVILLATTLGMLLCVNIPLCICIIMFILLYVHFCIVNAHCCILHGH
jgi:hypothetical protein